MSYYQKMGKSGKISRGTVGKLLALLFFFSIFMFSFINSGSITGNAVLSGVKGSGWPDVFLIIGLMAATLYIFNKWDK